MHMHLLMFVISGCVYYTVYKGLKGCPSIGSQYFFLRFRGGRGVRGKVKIIHRGETHLKKNIQYKHIIHILHTHAFFKAHSASSNLSSYTISLSTMSFRHYVSFAVMPLGLIFPITQAVSVHTHFYDCTSFRLHQDIAPTLIIYPVITSELFDK